MSDLIRHGAGRSGGAGRREIRIVQCADRTGKLKFARLISGRQAR